MRHLVFALISFCLMGCRNSDKQTSAGTTFQKYIPDTSNNWYAKLYDYPFYLKKIVLSTQLHITSLEQGKNDFEMRLWTLASNFDPQRMYRIFRNTDGWSIYQYHFYIRPGTWDNPIIDSQQVKPILSVKAEEFINTIRFDELWELRSQSEMPKGGNYGCVDGLAALIEMADRGRYKFGFYNCPDINADKDEVFKKVDSLYERVTSLSFQ